MMPPTLFGGRKQPAVVGQLGEPLRLSGRLPEIGAVYLVEHDQVEPMQGRRGAVQVEATIVSGSAMNIECGDANSLTVCRRRLAGQRNPDGGRNRPALVAAIVKQSADDNDGDGHAARESPRGCDRGRE